MKQAFVNDYNLLLPLSRTEWLTLIGFLCGSIGDAELMEAFELFLVFRILTIICKVHRWLARFRVFIELSILNGYSKIYSNSDVE